MKASHYYFQFACQQFINVLKKVGLTICSGKMIVIKATLSKYLGLDQATLLKIHSIPDAFLYITYYSQELIPF